MTNSTKTSRKKLNLHREQLRVLARGDLRQAAGGAPRPTAINTICFCASNFCGK